MRVTEINKEPKRKHLEGPVIVSVGIADSLHFDLKRGEWICDQSTTVILEMSVR